MTERLCHCDLCGAAFSCAELALGGAADVQAVGTGEPFYLPWMLLRCPDCTARTMFLPYREGRPTA